MGITYWASSWSGPAVSLLPSRNCMQLWRQWRHGAPAGGGGKKIQIYCDNNSVCQILRHRNSKSPMVAALLCTLYCLSVKFGCLVSATHLPGVDNTWADCLSRGWLEKFYTSCPQAALFPTDIGDFALDFSNEADPRSRHPHCDLATLVTRKLKEDRPCGWTGPLLTDLAGAARERIGPWAGSVGTTMDRASHSQSGWKQAPVVQASNDAICSRSQSANGVGAWCGRHGVITAPGK